MKFHWGKCGEQFFKEQWHQAGQRENALKKETEFLKDVNLIQNKENEQLKSRIVSLCNQYRLTASIEQSAVDMFNKLSIKWDELNSENEQLKKKIAHLEEVISDYNKVTLLQEQPVYIEAATLPQESKRKRKSV